MQTNFNPASPKPQANQTVVLPGGNTPAGKKKSNLAWETVGIGAATGVILGVGGAVALNAMEAHAEEPADVTPEAEMTPTPAPAPAPAPAPVHHHHHHTVVERAPETIHVEIPAHVEIADCVNDEMTYEEAFNAARAEVGPGGIFAWHGNVYTTFTDQEFLSLSENQLEQYNINTQIALNEAGVSEEFFETGGAGEDLGDFRPIEVSYDEQQGVTFGIGTMDGHMTIMVDDDNDGVFDAAGIDYNDNGTIEDNELVSIDGGRYTYNPDEVDRPTREPVEETEEGLIDEPGVGEEEEIYITPEEPEIDYINDADVSEYSRSIEAQPAVETYEDPVVEATPIEEPAEMVAETEIAEAEITAEPVAEVTAEAIPEAQPVIETEPAVEMVDELPAAEPEPSVPTFDDMAATDDAYSNDTFHHDDMDTDDGAVG